MNNEKLLEKIDKISSLSEKEFLTLSSCFPVLVQELRTGSNAAGKNDRMQKINSIKDEFTFMLNKQAEITGKNRAALETFHEKNDALYNSFSSCIEILQDMNDISRRIKDDSMEMEIISLNAMVVSIKSGKDGRTFSYITSNLKQISQNLIRQADALTENENSIQNAISSLEQAIKSVSGLGIEAKTDGDFGLNKLVSIINEITVALQDMLAAADKVLTPIRNAMECIQLQDIIRQSLADIVMAVRSIAEPDNDASPEDKLDQYTMNCRLSELAEKCFVHINENLEGSIQNFDKNKTETNAILTDIENRRKTFIEKAVGSRNDSYNLQICIDAAAAEFSEFIKMGVGYQNGQKLVQEQTSRILKEVHKMQECIEEFTPIITNLQYVAIAQRIEVARNQAINAIANTVEHMSELITHTDENVSAARKLLSDFNSASTEQMKAFTHGIKNNKSFFDSINLVENDFISKLNLMHSNLIQALSDFSVYSEAFFDAYGSINNSIEGLKSLVVLCREVQLELKEINIKCTDLKNEYQTKYNLSDRTVHNAVFNDFLKKFTVMADKYAIASVGGMHVDTGLKTGEVTLF